MLVVSPWGVNFRLFYGLTWVVLGGKTPTCSPYMAVKVSFRVSREEI